ncbi:MAG: tryptophan-rich sensory protein [Sandaracinaceae bacterium]
MPGKRALAVLNALVTVLVIGWNYWTAAFGLDGQKVGEMSERYDSLFRPAGYAFSIWGLIFLMLATHAGYQLWLAFRRDAPSGDATLDGHRASLFGQLGPLLILTNLANGLWTVLWLTEQTAASVVVLASMCVFLALAMYRLGMNRAPAPLEVRWFVRVPLGVYAGWVTVAVLANLSAFLAKHDLVSGESAGWAIGMIALATVYNGAALLLRGLRAHTLVAVWAFVAIAVARWGEAPSVQWTAAAAAATLTVAVVMHTAGTVRRGRTEATVAPG